MPRFFVGAENISGTFVIVEGRDTEHIRVLRIKPQEIFTVCDGQGADYKCRLISEGTGFFQAEILERFPSLGEPSVRCVIYAAFSKGDKTEGMIQQTVQIGVSEIVLFPSRRCVTRYDGQPLDKKMNRWQKISKEAAKQSGRGKIPFIRSCETFEQAICEAASASLPLFFYEDESQSSLKDALEVMESFGSISIVTGPEGGFEPSEAAFAKEHGMCVTSMGPRILRCETAPVCALSAVMLATGNL